MKKIIIAVLLGMTLTTAYASNITGATINGQRINVGNSYAEVAAKLGQPQSVYDYKKEKNGKEISVREAAYQSNGKTYVLTVEEGKVVSMTSGR